MLSTFQKIKRIEGLAGTKDVTPWEDKFIADIAAKANAGQVSGFSEKQMEVVDRLHDKHFAGE